jgi:hypothetical protein
VKLAKRPVRLRALHAQEKFMNISSKIHKSSRSHHIGALTGRKSSFLPTDWGTINRYQGGVFWYENRLV